MKTLKLTVEFEGSFASKKAHVLMPIESNGVAFGYLVEGETIERAVDLGELEGKHSECYGDLFVEIIDLSLLTPVQLNEVVKGSDYSSFEIFFEEAEDAFKKYIEELKEGEMKEFCEIELDQKILCKQFGLSENNPGTPGSDVKSRQVYKAFMEKVQEFSSSKSLVEVKFLASDLPIVQAMLLERGIKMF